MVVPFNRHFRQPHLSAVRAIKFTHLPGCFVRCQHFHYCGLFMRLKNQFRVWRVWTQNILLTCWKVSLRPMYGQAAFRLKYGVHRVPGIAGVFFRILAVFANIRTHCFQSFVDVFNGFRFRLLSRLHLPSDI